MKKKDDLFQRSCEGIEPVCGGSALFTILILLGSLILVTIFVPGCITTGKPSENLMKCQSNLKNIGDALEIYSDRNGGLYPALLDQVTPDYVKVLPTCPAAGTNSYAYLRSDKGDVYTMYCRGDYHSAVTGCENYPQYDTISGLMEP